MNGFWLLLKRLEQGKFKIQEEGPSPTRSITSIQLQWLLEGLDMDPKYLDKHTKNRLLLESYRRFFGILLVVKARCLFVDLNGLSKEELSTINKLEEQLDWYQRQIKLQQKQIYGRKSERIHDENQLSLFDELEVESSALKIEAELEEITYQRKKKKGKKEKDLLAFPVVQKIYDIPKGSTCSTCHGDLIKVIENIRKELVYYPARYEVIEHIQYVLECRDCETSDTKTTFEKGNMPPALLPKSIVSASLAGAIVHNKFGLSLPLYRQEVNFKQNGLNLSRQTLSNWLLKLYEYYLKDIHTYMHKQLLLVIISNLSYGYDYLKILYKGHRHPYPHILLFQFHLLKIDKCLPQDRQVVLVNG